MKMQPVKETAADQFSAKIEVAGSEVICSFKARRAN